MSLQWESLKSGNRLWRVLHITTIDYSICSHNRYLIWLQPTFHDDDFDSNSHWASKAALGWAAAQTEPDTFETSGSNEKGAWFEGLAPTWRLRALNVFWAYWCILWLWKNPTLMRFQARHACCSYPEWLPLENNSTNCSMHAMITSVLSNRNHPSFITLLGPEVFNLPGLWFKVQTIRKAKLQQNHCHFLAQCFANRSYRYARRSQPSWASYAKLPSTCSQSQQNLLSKAVFHLKNFLSKQHQTTFGFAVTSMTSMTSMTSLGLVIKPPFLFISIHF